MIRFAIYDLLFITSVAGTILIFINRGTLTPRLMAIAAPMSLTLAWSMFMVARTVLFWLGGNWGFEPPMSAGLAAVANGVILAWVATGLVILADKIRQPNG